MNIGEAVGRGVLEDLPEQGESVDRNDSRVERTKARVELLVVKGHESGKRGRNSRIAGATCKRRLARIDQVEDHDMASAGLEWHSGELYPRVGFIVTNLSRPAERVVAFYNQRGTAERWIKEGKNAIKWTRLSCRSLRNNAVRLQLHALA